MGNRPLVIKNGEIVVPDDGEELDGVVSELNGKNGHLTLSLNRGTKVRFSRVLATPSNQIFYNDETSIRGPVGFQYNVLEPILQAGKKYYFELSFTGNIELMEHARIGYGYYDDNFIKIDANGEEENIFGNSGTNGFMYVITSNSMLSAGNIVSNGVYLGNAAEIVNQTQRVRFAMAPRDAGNTWLVWISIDGGLWNNSVTADPVTGIGGFDTNVSGSPNIMVYRSSGSDINGFNYHKETKFSIPVGFELPQESENTKIFPLDSDLTLPTVKAIPVWDGTKFIGRYLDKNLIELGKVDNTRDAEKPVSLLQEHAIRIADVFSGGVFVINYPTFSLPPTFVIDEEIKTSTGVVLVKNGDKCAKIFNSQDIGDIYTMQNGTWVLTNSFIVGTRRVIFNSSGLIKSGPNTLRDLRCFHVLEKTLDNSGVKNLIPVNSFVPINSTFISHLDSLSNFSSLNIILGMMANLTTSNKTSIVAAINELDSSADEMIDVFNSLLNR